MPRLTVPRLTVPRLTVPRLTVPRLNVPRLTVPRLTVPRLTVPRLTVPRLTVPRLTVPRSNVPRLTVPRLTVPRLTVPRLTHLDYPAATLVLNFVLIEVLSSIYEHKILLFTIQITRGSFKKFLLVGNLRKRALSLMYFIADFIASPWCSARTSNRDWLTAIRPKK